MRGASSRQGSLQGRVGAGFGYGAGVHGAGLGYGAGLAGYGGYGAGFGGYGYFGGYGAGFGGYGAGSAAAPCESVPLSPAHSLCLCCPRRIGKGAVSDSWRGTAASATAASKRWA